MNGDRYKFDLPILSKACELISGYVKECGWKRENDPSKMDFINHGSALRKVRYVRALALRPIVLAFAKRVTDSRKLRFVRGHFAGFLTSLEHFQRNATNQVTQVVRREDHYKDWEKEFGLYS